MFSRRETESALITRCPYCETSFRVTEAHLQAANGAVRCGACLLVFPAREHMVDPNSGDQDTVVDENLPASMQADFEPGVDSVEPGDLSHSDDADGYREPDKDDEAEAWEITGNDEAVAEFEKWSSVEEDENDGEERDPYDLDPGFTEAIDVQSDPDDIIGPSEEPRKRGTVWWFSGALVLLLMLGVQFAWLQRTTLAQDVRYRPWYVTFCTYLGCKVPDYDEISALGTTSVTVRRHESVDEALVFDALLRNDARFKQRFPPLDLKFTDVKNETVAARRLRPQEYLGGEMAGLKYIPARTEVRISLEVVDPGRNALGYSLTVPENW